MRRARTGITVALVVAALCVAAGAPARAAEAHASLQTELGRSETRVWSAPYRPPPGRTVREMQLTRRLARLAYVRVKGVPVRPGQFAQEKDIFWIFRPAHRLGGDDYAALLFGLQLDADGRMTGLAGAPGAAAPRESDGPWVEPELIAESLTEDRVPRVPVHLDTLPEHAWRAVLAAEDERFFEHGALDPRAIARAMLRNLFAGRTVQGASTITQQLVKNRDLGPQRTWGRKLNEAMRAVWLESEYDKREILEAYVNDVYLGQVEGVGVYGFGAASRTYFGKPASRLTLAEAALLAGIIRSPNRLSPARHPDEARERRDQVLRRMGALGWAHGNALNAALMEPVRVTPAGLSASSHAFRAYVQSIVQHDEPDRLAKGRGVVVETTLDPLLQYRAEQAVAEHVAKLGRAHPALRASGLSAALVALDPVTGDVLAYVGGDPSDRADRFDRARGARRQPGSAIKPLLLAATFDACNDRDPIDAATPVSDRPVTVTLPDGKLWEPRDPDGRFRDVVTVRDALRHSYNLPFVRIARACGPREIARVLNADGLAMPDDPPLSFALGAVEVSPLELASAYTVFATPGKRVEPRPVVRIERPSGRRLDRYRTKKTRVARPASAYIVRDLMRDVVEHGTGQAARVSGLDLAGKTGTSTSERDAWFAGHGGQLVTAVWIGLDKEAPLGSSAPEIAAPLWRAFMQEAVPARAPYTIERPHEVVTRTIDPRTGLEVSSGTTGAYEELFRRGAQPAAHHWWRRDKPRTPLE